MLSVQAKPKQSELWEVVDIKEAGRFSIRLQKPTWDQITEDAYQRPGYLESRLKNCVVDWKDIEINGKAVTFNWENFQNLCEIAPVVFHVVSAHVSNLYYSVGEIEEKNSEAASSDT